MTARTTRSTLPLRARAVRSGRAGRWFAWLSLGLFLGGTLAEAQHAARHVHAYCAEHGRTEHVEPGSAVGHGPVGSDDHATGHASDTPTARTAGDGSSTEHLACAQFPSLPSRTATAGDAALTGRTPSAQAPWTDGTTAAQSRLAIWRFAPKTSPPTA